MIMITLTIDDIVPIRVNYINMIVIIRDADLNTF